MARGASGSSVQGAYGGWRRHREPASELGATQSGFLLAYGHSAAVHSSHVSGRPRLRPGHVRRKGAVLRYVQGLPAACRLGAQRLRPAHPERRGNGLLGRQGLRPHPLPRASAGCGRAHGKPYGERLKGHPVVRAKVHRKALPFRVSAVRRERGGRIRIVHERPPLRPFPGRLRAWRNHLERGPSAQRQSPEHTQPRAGVPAVFPHHLRHAHRRPGMDGPQGLPDA